VLALSAHHLARLKPEKLDAYESIATSLQKAGLDSVSRILPNITEENCSALFIFSSLTWINSLAVPNKPDELPPHSHTETAADWLVLLRGIVSVTMTGMKWLEKGDLAAMIAIRSINILSEELASHPADQHLVRLKVLITNTTINEKRTTMYCNTIDGLRKTFFRFEHLSNDTCVFPVLFSWPSLLSDEYTLLLGERDQEALAIFAFFAALLSRMNSCWWLKGWGAHLIARISKLLDPYHILWIRWAIDEVRLAET
jgi:hypothetical protein